MRSSIEDLNRGLSGFRSVLRIELEYDVDSKGAYSLTLDLAHDDGRRIALGCSNVSSMSLRGFGDGLSQITLRAIDISSRQLDRTSIWFTDQEHEEFGFYCSSAAITEMDI